MLTMGPTARVFVASGPVDLRKGFDSLGAMVQSVWGHDPLSGYLFVFYNRRRDQVRILFWDRCGYCIVAKRLARGRFRFPDSATAGLCVEMEPAEMALILEGIDLTDAQRLKRWRPTKKAA
jgi:transposase